jgi:hypothetical protein
MAGSKTVAQSEYVLDLMLVQGTVHVALFTDMTGAEASTPVEVTGAGYTRLQGSFTVSPTTTGAKAVLNAELNFGPCAEPTGWGEIKGFGIYQGATPGAGTLLYFGDLTNPRTINDTDIVRFAVNSIEIDES